MAVDKLTLIINKQCPDWKDFATTNGLNLVFEDTIPNTYMLGNEIEVSVKRKNDTIDNIEIKTLNEEAVQDAVNFIVCILRKFGGKTHDMTKAFLPYFKDESFIENPDLNPNDSNQDIIKFVVVKASTILNSLLEEVSEDDLSNYNEFEQLKIKLMNELKNVTMANSNVLKSIIVLEIKCDKYDWKDIYPWLLRRTLARSALKFGYPICKEKKNWFDEFLNYQLVIAEEKKTYELTRPYALFTCELLIQSNTIINSLNSCAYGYKELQ